jgi:very-short-patch-repair endonuclease
MGRPFHKLIVFYWGTYLAAMAGIERARVLRQTETWAEKLMGRWLRGRRFSGYKFRRQHTGKHANPH